MAALLCLGATTWADDAQKVAPWPHQSADIQPDPNVIWGQLDNGMRYVLLPNSTPKDRVSLRMLVAAGSLMEREDERGLAHLLEHMAFKGSEDMPAGDLVQYLERLGMAFGADTNASTSFDSTVYKLELPSNTPDLLDRSLFVLREKADKLLIPAADLEKERGVVLSEKRLRDTARYRAYVAGLDFLLPQARATQRWPIGLEEVVATAPRERLENFYRRYYTPSRITIIAVGAIDPASFIALLHKRFDSFHAQGSEGKDPDPGSVGPRGLETRLHYEAEGRTTVSLGVAKPYQAGPDTRARRTREINLYLANAVISRRLATLAQKPDAGFLGGVAQSDDFLEFAQIGFVLLDTQPDQWRKALGVAESELRRALTYGFTPAELEEQKKNLLSEYQEASRGAATRESPGLADNLVRDLTEDRVFTAPDQDLREISEILALVSPETAMQELRALWADSGPLVFVSGPVKVDGAEAAIAEAYRASRAQAVTPPADNAVAKFAYTQFGTRSPIVERRVSDPMQVTQLRFGNNVRVNLKRTPFEATAFWSPRASAAARSTCRPASPASSSLPTAPFSRAG